MEIFLNELVFWHWFIAALIFVILEMMVPSMVIIWLGFGAGITGLILFIRPDMAWEAQLMLFALFSVASGFGGRYWLSKRPIETDQPLLNKRGNSYIGRTLVLEDAISNGTGKVRVDDTFWKVQGEDQAAGEVVRVTGVDGAMLLVESAESS